MEEKEKDALQQEKRNMPKEEMASETTADTTHADMNEEAMDEQKVDEISSKNDESPDTAHVPMDNENEAVAIKVVEENDPAAEFKTEPTVDEASTDMVEVETDEQEVDEYASEGKELLDYAHMPLDKLAAEAENLLATHEAKDIKDEMEAIHSAAMAHFDEERTEKLHAFIEDGGVEMDFQFDQPLKWKILDFYKAYKHKRHLYYKQLEEELNVNLDVKKTIIEAIKELPNTEGSVPDKYKQFRDYQDRWKNTGPVPRAESNELWNNYHHHVDNFYDFLHISNELRDLDFKKNLEAKTMLCEEAEALSELESNADTFKALQDLHKKWKQTGPVDREHREPMWERFSLASSKIHDKRHAYYQGLRASREELLNQKREIIEKMAAIDMAALKSHSAWQKAIKEVNALRDAFKEVGRINLPENDKLWESFREINRAFNKGKNEFYKELKGQHQKNLERKRELLAKAQELSTSEDWREASNQLKRIQSEWKTIGYVPKNESDKIWKAFREACNLFFNRLTKHNKQLDKDLEANLVVKNEILERLNAWTAPEGGKGNGMKELKAFINEWKEAGRVPRSEKEIDNEFNKTLDNHFTTLKLNKKEASLIRFENKVHNLIEGENDRQLDREQEILQRKVDEAIKDLNQLENNILFFAHADQNNPIVKEARRQIDNQKEQIELLKSKVKMIRKMSNEN